MTPETYKLIKKLRACTFAPATYDKRFVRDMADKPPDEVLSEKQLLFLGQLAYRYRKQLETKNGLRC